MKSALSKLAQNFFSTSEPQKIKRDFSQLKPREKHQKAIEEIKASILLQDLRSTEVRHLLRLFGYKRKGSKNIDLINHYFEQNDLYSYPPLTEYISTTSRIQIYNFPVVAKGDLFPDELELQKFIDRNNSLKQLGLINPQREHSPNSTTHRMDFFARDLEGNSVVIEVKKECGQNRAVQQVLRYASIAKRAYPNTKVRKVLITRKQDLNTAKAIHGMTETEQQDFEWYLYNYSKRNQTLSFEKVEFKNLFKYFD